MSESQLRQRAAVALSAPLLQFLGVSSVDEGDPASGLSLMPQGNALNALGGSAMAQVTKSIFAV